jgi:hypothetical protein
MATAEAVRTRTVKQQIERVSGLHKAAHRLGGASVMAVEGADPSYFIEGLSRIVSEEDILRLPAEGITQGNQPFDDKAARELLAGHVLTIAARRKSGALPRSHNGVVLIVGHDFSREKGSGNPKLQQDLRDLVKLRILPVVITGTGTRQDLPTSARYDHERDRGLAGELSTYALTSANEFHTFMPDRSPRAVTNIGVPSLTGANTQHLEVPGQGHIEPPVGNTYLP